MESLGLDGFTLAAILVGYAAFSVLMIIFFWRIYRRAGLWPMLSLLFAIPIAGPLVTLMLLAFTTWPMLSPLHKG